MFTESIDWRTLEVVFSRRLQISLALGSVAVLFAAMIAVNSRLSWRPVSVDFAPTPPRGSGYFPITWRGDKLWILDSHNDHQLAVKNYQWKEVRNWNRKPLPIMCAVHELSGLTVLHPHNDVFVRSREGGYILLPPAPGKTAFPAIKERGHRNRFNVMKPGEINLLSFSPDGKRLAASSHLYGYGDHQEKLAGFCGLGLVVFDTQSTKQIARQSAFEGSFSDIAWSPDSRQLAGITVDGFVFVLDATTGKLKRKFRAHKLWGAQIAWSPDGKTIVTASNPRVGMSPTAIEFDLKSGTGFMMRDGGSTTIGEGKDKIAITHTSNGDAMANGKTERLLKRFDAQTGKQIGSAISLRTGAVDMAFSPDGKQLALGQHEFALLLNAQTLATERRLNIPKPATIVIAPAPVCVAWSQDGATIATSTERGLTLWRVR